MKKYFVSFTLTIALLCSATAVAYCPPGNANINSAILDRLSQLYTGTANAPCANQTISAPFNASTLGQLSGIKLPAFVVYPNNGNCLAPAPVVPKPAEPTTPTPVAPKPAEPVKPAPTQPGTTVSAYEAQVVTLVNEERAKYGLPALTLNAKLSDVARLKSQDMRDKGYFSHTSPTYGSPFDMMRQFGITYKSAGENIAYGQKTPQVVVTAWMNSQGHRANILNANFTQIGVGYVSSGNYWTQMFIG